MPAPVTVTGLPAKPAGYTKPAFDPTSAGSSTSLSVAQWTVDAATTVQASITGGSSFFHLVALNFYTLELEIVDPTDLLHPPPHPIRTWNMEPAGSSNGAPVQVAAGTVVELVISLSPAVGTPSGALAGTVTIGTGPAARVIQLTGSCLGLDVTSNIGRKYTALGGAAFMGKATSTAGPVPNNVGTFQRYDRGAIWDVPGQGTYFVTWQVMAKWDDHSVANTNTPTGDTIQHNLGTPIEDSFATAESGFAQRFTNGVIVARPNNRNFHVRGAIYVCYAALGDLKNPKRLPSIGWPTADESGENPAGARFSTFDGGEIHWSAASGAHVLQADILAHWRSAGLFSTLGLPITNQLVAADGVGRYSRFQQGSIAWTPRFGAHEVPGPAADQWHGTRGPSGWLGYPLSLSSWTHPTSKRPGQLVRFQYASIGVTPQDAPLVTPDQQTFSGVITTPSGTALGGQVSLTVRSNGTWEFKCHMHDSGADDYSFAVRVLLSTASGTALALQTSGTVSGHIIGGGGRDFDHDESNTVSDPAQASDILVKQQIQYIQDHWPDIAAGQFSVAHSYQDTGILGSIESVLSDLATWAIGAVLGGVPLATMVFIGSDLGKHLGVRVVGPGGLVGVVVAGASVLVMGPLGFVVGAVAGAIAAAAIKHRTISDQEYAFANEVFKGTLPPQNQIILTNLHNGEDGDGLDRCFTIPNVDGSILVNLGNDCFNNPMQHTGISQYKRPGQVFIHELTHAWQIFHRSFTAGLLCDVVTKRRANVDSDIYAYGTPDTKWGDFGLEQQAHIVDDWFGASRGPDYGHTASATMYVSYEDIQDPFFHYIANNLWLGDTG